MVAQEVILARLEAMSSQAQIRLAFQNKHDSQASLKLNLERSRAALGLPIEALQAIRANAQANREYLQAVANYNRSQFRLLEAVGSAPRTPQEEQ